MSFARFALKFLSALCTAHFLSATEPVDFKGPDGILYPDWRRAGVPGGIPHVPGVARLADFGGLPNDEKDDSDALEAALRRTGAAGGGAVELDAGTYLLSRPLCVMDDGVVLRGAGMKATRIEFTYGLSEGEVRWISPRAGERVSLDTTLEVHAFPGTKDSTYEATAPGQLESLAIEYEGKVVAEIKAGEGGPFRCALPLWRLTREAGALTLTARARWVGGRTESSVISFETTGGFLPAKARRLAAYDAAITFIGDEWSYRGVHRWLLAADTLRGSDRVVVTPGGGEFRRPIDLKDVTADLKSPKPAEVLAPGDYVMLTAGTPEAWKKSTGNVRDFTRTQYARVASLEGGAVVLDRPLRTDFRVRESARLDVRHPLRGGGVEGLTLVQTRQLWTHGIQFKYADSGWVRDVSVLKAGRSPIAVEDSSHIELRDCLLEDGWYQLGGGTSYFGFGTAFDCLAERIWTKRLRHAPCVNWSAAGNVFRESVFEQSDANWHTAWTHENLVERCVVVAEKGSGSYGYGVYTSRHASAHAGTGPRNVFYGNEILSPESSIYLGGAVEGTIFAYNRFLAKRGPAITADTRSDGVILKGNVFRVAEKSAPMIKLLAPSSSKWTLSDNVVHGGSGTLGAENSLFATHQGTRFMPFDVQGEAARPPVASLFLWQKSQHPLAQPPIERRP